MPIPISAGDEWEEFLMRAVGSGEPDTLSLTLWLRDNGGNFIPADSWRVTVKDTEQFWAFYSARDKAQGESVYTVEDGRFISAAQYQQPAQIGGYRDPAKSKCVVMVHGYNNTAEDARKRFNEMHRRLYWLGFRGQFIGVTWHGDVGLPSALFFDSSTRNAFQTSLGLRAFLREQVSDWAGGWQNIDVMAHSLGNLVIWDAMRLHQVMSQSPRPLFRNFISVEAAVWPETFEAMDVLSYSSEANPANNIVYSLDQQMQHTWRAWFRHPERPASASLGGGIYHSYVSDDEALELWMRRNCWFWRGGYHYDRHLLSNDEWRRMARPEGDKTEGMGWRRPSMEQTSQCCANTHAAGKPIVLLYKKEPQSAPGCSPTSLGSR